MLKLKLLIELIAISKIKLIKRPIKKPMIKNIMALLKIQNNKTLNKKKCHQRLKR
jgi:hypothetical protein